MTQRKRKLPKIRNRQERERDELRERLAYTLILGGGMFFLGFCFSAMICYRRFC